MPASPLYLVDGSAYVYRAFFALPPLTSPAGLPTNAVYGFTTMVLKLLKDVKPELLALVFDAPGKTFREEIYTEYKSNRPPAPDDLIAQWPLVHRVAKAFRLPSLTIPGVEADDVIGSLVERFRQERVEVVVVTSDKDLMQLVGPGVRLWDTMRDRWTDEAAVRKRFGVGPDQLVEVFALAGDPIDNVPGVKGIGEKTAVALVQHFGSVEAALRDLDGVARLGIRGAKRVAELLRSHAGEARLSRDLVEIRKSVELDVSLSQMRYPGPDTTVLRTLFDELGFQSLLRDLPAPPPAASPEPLLLEAEADVAAFAASCTGARSLALACVGAGAAMQSACSGIVVAADTEEPRYVPGRTPLVAALAPALGHAGAEKIGHDLKADLLWLARLGLSLAGPLFDTMVASYVAGASTTHRLEALSESLLGETIESFRDGDVGEQGVAAGVRRLGRLRAALAQRLSDEPMRRLFYDVEMPLVEVLARMERRGVRVDTEALRGMGSDWRHSLEALSREIYDLAGGEFNINSPPQLREVLFERLGLSKKGVRRGKTGLSTDVDVLNRLAAEHALPAKILEYRALSKLLSTYADALIDAVHPETGRLHTVFRQTVAATGRLSSTDPNLQNIPIRGEEGRRIRSAFIPADGCLLVSADYSQIELRVMAHLAEDPVLLSSFERGEDIHARTAAEMFGVLPGTVTTEMRRAAKVINFGIMYGMGPQRLATELGVPLVEAQKYIARYFERYRGVRAFMDRTVELGRQAGYVTTLFGRRRSLPELQSRDRGTAQAAERAAINAPIQGTAADLIKIAMVGVDRHLRKDGRGAGMILQVHDELLLEVPEDEIEAVAGLVKREMEGAARLRVPLAVEIGTGKTWAEAH